MAFEQKKIQFSFSEDALWMPVYTLPRHEFRLHQYFEQHRIPAYLPVVPALKVHNVHKKNASYTYKRTTVQPMFSSYVFARMTEEQKRNSWRSNSILRIWQVSEAEQPSFIEELLRIQMMEELAQKTKLEFRSDIKEGDRFVIESPPYEGTCGYLLEKRKKFLWSVKLEFLNMTVQAEIDPADYKMRKME